MSNRRLVIENAADFGRVAVMYGGFSSEREVSLDTGAAVLSALQSRDIDAYGWDPAEKSLTEFSTEGFDRVWIALHGTGGEDGGLQGMLKWLNTPYTGSGILASAVAMLAIELARRTHAPGLTYINCIGAVNPRIDAALRMIDRERAALPVDEEEATALAAELASAFGRPLKPTVMWDHPTPTALARHLAGTDGTTSAVSPVRS